MNYPGNETLAEEIRTRILNTFRQTLELAEKGDQREAQLGCDFVLRLDPLFEPARALNERLQADSGPISVADLRATLGESASGGRGEQPPASDAPTTLPTEDLDPILPPAGAGQPDAGSPLPDLDTASKALDSALDMSSLEADPAPTPPSQQESAPIEETTAAPEPPPAPPIAEETSSPAGTEPVATLDNESEQRVQDLLTEGQAAFDNAEYQSAIDAWSRIFLIDIDHPEANRRIDLARKLKAEVERKLEETFHEALTKVETGRLDEARAGFETVLEMMPGHIAAREYLDRLDAPDFVAPEPVATPAPEVLTADLDDDPLTEGEFSEEFDSGLDEPLHAPVSAEAQPRPTIGGVGRASKQARSPSQTFRTVGVAMLVLLAVAGWFLYKNWDSFFPNATDASAPVKLDPITRAKRTYAEAGAAIAIAQLRRLSPGHPQYAEAQALVAQWEATLDASKPKEEAPEPEALAERDRLVDEARSAFGQNEFLQAHELLELAAAEASLDSDAKQMREEAQDEIDHLQAEIAMFREGEWEMALRNLWRMWEGGEPTPDIRRLMVDSYYNLGVRDLQRQDTSAALSNLKEADELSVEDPELSRLIDFAQTYEDQPEELLYRIFVKYLPFR